MRKTKNSTGNGQTNLHYLLAPLLPGLRLARRRRASAHSQRRPHPSSRPPAVRRRGGRRMAAGRTASGAVAGVS
ncbi:hypothetical protein PORY_001871 [Pneumocystis oryctolagi]|uniref:Uncharacterized protein n=1 Tax=Pneumocystis oryctolagi TaxID=42067 RepID=A0ACB7CCZ2_9ASCO|nr:hypothetical protein PORY_001871 [Pneumocystis oryctolagi]